MEVTSKRPVGRFRKVVDGVKKDAGRDPRFDPLCGRLNQDLFEKSFSFLDDYRQSEIKEISDRLKKEQDADEKSRMHELLAQMVRIYRARDAYWRNPKMRPRSVKTI
jgi:ribosomal RNA-processing protein 36